MLIKIGRKPDHGFNEPLGLLSDCHRRIEHFLGVLVAIAERTNGGPLMDFRSELEGARTYFATAAPRHTADEEESLFPRLRESIDPRAAAALEHIRRLERDHDAADARHQTVDRLVRTWLSNGSLSPSDVGELRMHLDALQTLYRQHIRVEDEEVFPAAAEVLSSSQVEDIGREMARRRERAYESGPIGRYTDGDDALTA